MTTVKEIYDYIDSFAPFETQESYDNSGIIVGNGSRCVTKAIVSLDITREVVEEAVLLGANLIISHHPVIFSALKRLDFDSVPALLLKNGISAIAVHTNLDKSGEFGVNICLANAVGLKNVCAAADILFVGETEKEVTSDELAEMIKSGLSCQGVSYTRMCKKISKVGICSGAGGSGIFLCKKFGCDAFITGEIKHHEIIAANEMGVSVFSLGHYKSEDVVIAPLAKKLRNKFQDTEFVKSKVFTDGITFI